MKVYKLVYGKEIIGYRLAELSNKSVKLDMTPKLAEEVLCIINPSKLKKGSTIQMRQRGDEYVSSDEQGAINVKSLEDCLPYIELEDFILSDKDLKFRVKLDAKFSSIKSKYDFSDLKGYEENEVIKRITEKLKSAGDDVICHVYCLINTYKGYTELKVGIHLPNLQETGKFLHNWFELEGAIYVFVKTYSKGVIRLINMPNQISRYLKEVMYLKDGYCYPDSYIPVESIEAIGQFEIELNEDIILWLNRKL